MKVLLVLCLALALVAAAPGDFQLQVEPFQPADEAAAEPSAPEELTPEQQQFVDALANVRKNLSFWPQT